MPPAARVGDSHTCPLFDNGVPHVGGVLVGPAVPTVLIGGAPAAVVGDAALCTGPPDAIAQGSGTVLIGNSPAARRGDASEHGGTITTGLSSVVIGG